MTPHPKTTVCPVCGDTHYFATAIDKVKKAPREGDATICISCGTWCLFESSAPGGLRLPTDQEQNVMRHDPRFAEVWRAWDQTKRRV